jgi:hypothetical protein
MNATVVPPSDYAGLVGCAALGELSTMGSPRCYAQPRAGCRVFLRRLCGYIFMVELCGAKKGGVNDLGKLR